MTLKKQGRWPLTSGFLKNNLLRKYNMQKFKKKPGYYQELLTKPNRDLILIAKDWNALNLIRRGFKSICLLCEDLPILYDLTFCFQKEVWVLYSSSDMLKAAMELARFIQFIPAKKVFAIQVRLLETLQGGKYDK